MKNFKKIAGQIPLIKNIIKTNLPLRGVGAIIFYL